jgi:AraC-like DNA-binding protein
MTPHQRTHTVLAAYARLIVELVAHWSVSPEQLLGPCGLAKADLADPLARLPLETMLRLIERARALTGEPGLGWYMGLQSRISMYGYLGFGMLSAATIRDAIELLVRFNPLLGTVLTFRLEVDDDADKAAIVIEENTDLGSSRDFVLTGFAVALWQLGSRLSGSTPTSSVSLMIPQPHYFRRITRIGLPPRFVPGRCELDAFIPLGPPIRFDQPSNRYTFDRAKLQTTLVMADEAANKLARAHCEQWLGAFAENLVERVRRAISTDDGFRTLAEVARELHVSIRTLKRRLAELGLTFSTLSVEARRDKALLLLRASKLSNDEIADRLGYSTTANFSRAFQGWTRMSPSAYRRQSSSRPERDLAPGRH